MKNNMKNNRMFIFAFSIAFLSIVVALFLYFDKRKDYIKETLSPVEFETGLTKINPSVNESTLEWTTYSKLTKGTISHHDFSLLFEDGKLKDRMEQIQENEKSLSMNRKIIGQKNTHFIAITFHQTEFDYPKNKKKTKQLITSDELSFLQITPFSETQAKENFEENLHNIWHDLIKHYQVKTEHYTIIPLTNIDEWNNRNFPNFTAEQSAKIISTIIETIYTYYFSGTPKGDGTFMSPIGSFVPLILIPKNENAHLLILFRSEDGKNVQIIKALSI